MNSATATSIETSNGSASVSQRSGHDVTQNEPNNRTNGNGNGTATTTTKPPKKPGQKYRHVAAVHKQTRPSSVKIFTWVYSFTSSSHAIYLLLT
ncbi:hypothetical protein LB505_000195 [Fusarium chuoi]|nr:hypothetical protein LB505_000195 [Fusarium chuoi]